MTIIFGSNDSDTLDGTGGSDRISGWDSLNAFDDLGPVDDNDAIFGGGGFDTVLGGGGGDTLYGGRGNDLLFGQDGVNVLRGGIGDDHVFGTKLDRMYGGTGVDMLDVTLTTARSVNLVLTDEAAWHDIGFVGVAGFEAFQFAAGRGDDTIIGGPQFDILQGRNGNDLLRGGAGDDWIAGDVFPGRDTDPRLNHGNFDTLFGETGADRMHGGAGRDNVFGGTGGDEIFGEEWQDRLFGGDGNDTIFGAFGDPTYGIGESGSDIGVRGGAHSGHDEIFGGAGDDFISGDGDDDFLRGGSGADTFFFSLYDPSSGSRPPAVDKIGDFASGEDNFLLFSLQWIGWPGKGPLADADFVIGTEALDGNDRALYDPLTGEIRVDFDGTGPLASLLFAKLQPGTPLVAGDFIVDIW